jgi:hypothetical protein
MTWTYPIIRGGLVYVADINQGLYVLRYSGPHPEEVARVAFTEGNSNLVASLPATAGPSAAPASPRSSGRSAAVRPASFPTGVAVAILIGVVLVAGTLAVAARRRRRR